MRFSGTGQYSKKKENFRDKNETKPDSSKPIVGSGSTDGVPSASSENDDEPSATTVAPPEMSKTVPAKDKGKGRDVGAGTSTQVAVGTRQVEQPSERLNSRLRGSVALKVHWDE